jgi:hypothetical protein
LRDVGAVPRVVDVPVAGRPTRDEQAVALIDVDADRLPSAVGDELRALAGAEVAPPDAAGRDRADVEGVAGPDRDPLRLPGVRQVDVSGTFCARGSERQGQDETSNRHEQVSAFHHMLLSPEVLLFPITEK